MCRLSGRRWWRRCPRCSMAWKNCLQSDSRRSHSVGSPDAASASLYDRSGKMIFKARCWMLSSLSDCCSVSVVCYAGQAYSVSDLTTAVNTLSMLWGGIPARLRRVRKYNRWAALLCTTSTCSPHVKSEVMVTPSIAWWSERVRCLFPGW